MATAYPSGEPYNPTDFVLTSTSSAASPYLGISNVSPSNTLTVTQTNDSIVTIGTTYNTTSGATTPISISSGGYIYVDPAPADEIKSKPAVTEEHAHDIQCRLRVESTKVISDYFCNHCEEVLFSKVISKIPKSIINKKCLSRIVKGV